MSAATRTFNSCKPEKPNDLHKRITAVLLVLLFSANVFAVNRTASSGYDKIYLATFFSDVGKLSNISLKAINPPLTCVINTPSSRLKFSLFYHHSIFIHYHCSTKAWFFIIYFYDDTHKLSFILAL